HNINYNITGTGEAVIFLHNGFYSTETWNNIRNEISSQYKMIDYNRFGYGKSDHFNTFLKEDIIENGIAELKEFIEKLELDRFFLCGHCLGGAIALLYAARNPEKVIKVISESTGFFSDHKLLLKSDLTFRNFDEIDNNLRTSLINMHGYDYSKEFWKILCNYHNGYIMKESYNILDEVKKIKCPVLLINGDRDFYFDINHVALAYKKI
ncbi:MAG: hypothetical protein A2355_01955, partial [Spirochaetes bacterium RIFOXYB1_FULL_32_8]